MSQHPAKLRNYFEGRGHVGDAVVVQTFTASAGWVTLDRTVEATVDNLRALAASGVANVAVARDHRSANEWKRNNGRGVGVADFTLAEILDPTVKFVERKGRPALTSHQRDLFLRLSADRPRNIGSPSGMAHLVDKGYARRIVEYGPLGGTRYSYVAIP